MKHKINLQKNSLFKLFISTLIITSLFFLLFYSINKHNKNVYTISFGDSGVGGLIFALDVYKELNPFLSSIQKDYNIHFEFQFKITRTNIQYFIMFCTSNSMPTQ